MRVLHVLDTFESGGAQRVAIGLSKWLGEHGVDITMLGDDGVLLAEASEVARVILRPPSARSFPRQVRHLMSVVKSVEPDIIHVHQRREALAALMVGVLCGVPVVEHAHTRLPKTDYRGLSFRSAHIFAVSEQVRDMLISNFARSPEKITVVGNAPAHMPRDLETPADSYEPHVPLRVLGIGRITEAKDPVRFVEVVSELGKRRDVDARWAGDGELRDAMSARISQLEAPVTLLGEVNDVAAHLEWADVLVLTSRWEGLPLVVLEAMAHRVPVVATAVGGVGRVLSRNRGVLVSADAAPGAIADRIDESLADSSGVANRLEEARRFIVGNATPAKVFRPVLEVYKRLARSADVSVASENGRVSLYGVPLDVVSPEEAATRVEVSANTATMPYLVVTPNSDHFLRLVDDPELLALYGSADLSVPDGMPLVAMLRQSGFTSAQRVTGVDLFMETCRRLAASSGAIAIVGGVGGVADDAALRLQAMYRGLRVPVVLEPTPEELLSPEYIASLARQLRDAGVDTVALCLGSPKQELLYSALREAGAPSVPYLCVGAAVDFAAGSLRRAPRVLQDAGLEWAFRLVSEPKRLWRRYLLENTRVLPYMLKTAWHGRRLRRQWTGGSSWPGPGDEE
jgi:exopolysaccharide biosynthesis WecB/TagA/CpsF family protein